MNCLSKTLIPIGIAAAALTITACKPKSNTASETQSLDNFAKKDGSAETINKCGIEYDGKEKLPEYVESVRNQVKGADEYRNVALGVMAAVPENLMGPFFALKGKVFISSRAESLCRDIPVSDAEKGMGANSVKTCWRQPAPGQPPEIILPEDIGQIRHGLLRMFSYTFTEAFVGTMDASKPGELKTDGAKQAAASFLAERDKLAKTFLADLKRLKRPDVYAKLSGFQKKDSNKFGNYVYAEALDSYYCSADSRATFKSMFKKTWRRFTSTKLTNSPVKVFGSK